jgi:DNA processing protein
VRNRVIAALANGTLVVQATPRSGSLITARHALDLGREVWAVPGRIFDERSLGPHALIRDGALLVQHPRDLLELLLPRTAGSAGSTRSAGSDGPAAALSLPEVLPEPPAGLPGEVLAALAPGAFEVPEDLAGRIGLPLDRLLGALLELELSGWVKRRPGPVYGR